MSPHVIQVDRVRLVKPQLLIGDIALKSLESPQSDGFDTQNYNVGIYKNAIVSEFIVDGNYPRIVIKRLAPAYFTKYAVDMYDSLLLTL